IAGGTYKVPAASLVDFGYNLVDDDAAGGVDDDYEKNFVKFQVEGTYMGVTRKVEILLSRVAGGVYWNAVFAGNSSGDPYTLGFTGTGSVYDRIVGDMYSGGSIAATGTAQLVGESGSGNNTVTYAGANSSTVTGPVYTPGTQPALSLPRNVANQTIWEEKALGLRSDSDRRGADGVAFFDVAYDLSAASGLGATSGTWGNNSTATQLTNSSEASHIFRKNPTMDNSTANRTLNYEYSPSAKNDYYVEDPTVSGYNTRTMSNDINGSTSATAVNLSANGNNAVYFIDGNMRVSAQAVKTYQFVKPSGMGDLKMTMVVKGNVSFTDNLVYPTWQSPNDALAIIAVSDPAYPNVTAADFAGSTSSLLTSASGKTVSTWLSEYNARAASARASGKNITNIDLSTLAGQERAAQEYNKSYGSGNVFFGDPGSGTVEHFEAYMYAEQNFYATNLNSTTSSGGTQKVEIFGNMTAGNQVKIVRDTTTGYIPLNVTLDTLIKTDPSRAPPALPQTPGYGSGDWLISSWKQVP
ncbi:MAG TPA: hypothetical protein VJB14_14870, partial [Planctomycetota bacterium]|nr:hypothetical protein [Planctomycetota bacterium]